MYVFLGSENYMTTDYFDVIAEDYDYWKNRNRRYYTILKRILSQKISSKWSVLDFGCGTGDLLAHLSPKDGIGYDPSSEMVELCRHKYPSLQWSNNIPHKKFDAVYSVDVLEHVRNLDIYIQEMKSCLKPNGTLILIFANPYWEPLLILLEKLKLKMPEGPHIRLSNKTVKQHLERNGMQVSHIDYEMPAIKKLGLIEIWTIY